MNAGNGVFGIQFLTCPCYDKTTNESVLTMNR